MHSVTTMTLLVVSLVGLAPASNETSELTFTGAWVVDPSPNVGDGNNALYGVTAISHNDVWAVGFYYNEANVTQTLVEHWDGTAWTVVPSPSPGTIYNALSSVASVSATDVWAVGSFNNGVAQTLVLHWDGISWEVIPSPNVGTQGSALSGVTTLSPTDAWAVGLAYPAVGVSRTLIEHWDGVSWKVVRSPSSGTTWNQLYGVSASSATDIWAVGHLYSGTDPSQTLIERWNGLRWTRVRSPTTQEGSILVGVSSVSSTDAWAVGFRDEAGSPLTLALRWNGTRWRPVSTPHVGVESVLYGVDALSPDFAWAVGRYTASDGAAPRTLIEFWDGTAWTVFPSPNVGTANNELQGVSALSEAEAWAVFYYSDTQTGAARTLIEHFS